MEIIELQNRNEYWIEMMWLFHCGFENKKAVSLDTTFDSISDQTVT